LLRLADDFDNLGGARVRALGKFQEAAKAEVAEVKVAEKPVDAKR
jgi:hypothetical protein